MFSFALSTTGEVTKNPNFSGAIQINLDLLLEII